MTSSKGIDHGNDDGRKHFLRILLCMLSWKSDTDVEFRGTRMMLYTYVSSMGTRSGGLCTSTIALLVA